MNISDEARHDQEHYLLVDKQGRILGGAIMILVPGERRRRLFWTLPALEMCHWIAGGRRKRPAKVNEWRGVGALPYARAALLKDTGTSVRGEEER